MRNIKIKHIAFICIGLVIFAQQVNAGKLDDFEKDATKKKTEDKNDDKRSFFDKSNCLGGCLGLFFAEAIPSLFITTVYFGVVSWRKVDSDNSPLKSPISKDSKIVEKRDMGEALIPFLRVDISYQNVQSDVQALDYRAELGYGPLGVQIQHTRYKEDDPSDALDVNQVHLLYRMSLIDDLEIDLGLGGMLIDGNEENSGFSFTTPVLYHQSEHIGFEFRPSWNIINGNSIQDYDLALLTGWRYFSIRTGYRWFLSENESLFGPFIGLSLKL